MNWIVIALLCTISLLLALAAYHSGYKRGLLKGLTAYATLDMLSRRAERAASDMQVQRDIKVGPMYFEEKEGEFGGFARAMNEAFDGFNGFSREEEE